MLIMPFLYVNSGPRIILVVGILKVTKLYFRSGILRKVNIAETTKIGGSIFNCYLKLQLNILDL